MCTKYTTGLMLITYLSVMLLASCTKGKRFRDNSGIQLNTSTDLNEGDTTFNYIFRQRYEGYACYRIPAIIRAKDGSLIAFAEARKNSCSDIGDIDMVMKRSTDGGATWSGIKRIWDDGSNTCGNPAPVVDESTGNIYLLMTWNNGADNIGAINGGTSKDTRRVFVTMSSDNGASWATPKEITSQVKRDGWAWYATGPCHGIQLTSGDKKGRLIIPCDYIEASKSGGRSFSHVIYSDDHGQTWQIGGVAPLDKSNESTVAELSNGDVMLNMRRSSGTSRYVATSTDYGITWKNMKTDDNLIEPVCQGSLLSSSMKGVHTLFFSNPASLERKKMTIKKSTDNGMTWTQSYLVYAGPSAYSDIVKLTDTHIGILYEAGVNSAYMGIGFKVIPLSAFK